MFKDNVDVIIQQLSQENQKIKRTCGYKKAVVYQKHLTKSNREIGLQDSEPIPKQTKLHPIPSKCYVRHIEDSLMSTTPLEQQIFNQSSTPTVMVDSNI